MYRRDGVQQGQKVEALSWPESTLPIVVPLMILDAVVQLSGCQTCLCEGECYTNPANDGDGPKGVPVGLI